MTATRCEEMKLYDYAIEITVLDDATDLQSPRYDLAVISNGKMITAPLMSYSYDGSFPEYIEEMRQRSVYMFIIDAVTELNETRL